MATKGDKIYRATLVGPDGARRFEELVAEDKATAEKRAARHAMQVALDETRQAREAAADPETVDEAEPWEVVDVEHVGAPG